MTTFLVSYDLNRPNGDNAYPNLINALKRDGAVKILYSEWLVRMDATGAQVRDRYLAHMDANDSIFVTAVSNWAYKGIMNADAADGLLQPSGVLR